MISIHAPREGGDRRKGLIFSEPRLFQSTPPARGATAVRVFLFHDVVISIHAPREGGDASVKPSIGKLSPFQSTPPARGATVPQWNPFRQT